MNTDELQLFQGMRDSGIITEEEFKRHEKRILNEPKFKQQVQRNCTGKELEKSGRLDEAIKLYEQNIFGNFEGDFPYNRLAIIYHKRKQFQDEIRVLQKAIQVFSSLMNDERKDVSPKLNSFNERLNKILSGN